MTTVDTINEKVRAEEADYIAECENNYREKIRNVVDRLISFEGRTLLMLAGPSSSGKTTSAKIMTELIREHGRNAVVVSLDDFYKDQNKTPRLEDGTLDFETVHALDIDLFAENMHSLIRTGECYMPVFDFAAKKSLKNEKHLKIGENDIVIVEGLHALNPLITEPLSDEAMFKVYISVSTRIYDCDGNVAFTKRDIRFFRRIIRDYQFRDSSVEFTFGLWKSVRRGEDLYLFPFSKNADVKLDTIHPYELCVYNNFVTELLEKVEAGSEYYDTAQSYITRLSRLRDIPFDEVPGNSLLREFIGYNNN